MAGAVSSSWRATHAAPRVPLEPFTAAEILALLRGGELEAERCELLLAWSARVEGSIDVALAEGLHALRQGDRLAALACHLDDYAREVLDLGRRAALGLARLGRELATRPLLREAMRAGRVRLRAAQTILPVAVGADEGRWVALAEALTVRELEAEVRRAGAAGEDDERWLRLRAGLRPEEREVLDEALDVAAELIPGSGKLEQLEAVAQEFAGSFPADPDVDHVRLLPGTLRPCGAAADAEERRAARLEAELERWSDLPPTAPIACPELLVDAATTADALDAQLRELASLRAGWDDLVGYCALALKKARLHERFGFASFRHYCEERLGLPARAVEQRAALEERRWASPALRAAKEAGLPFEKVRLLAPLPERDIAAWAARAADLTCIALRRELTGEAERQMRAQRRLSIPVPARVAAVVAACIQLLRERVGPLSAGECLAVMAAHFLETWGDVVKGARTRSQKARERDAGRCQVPGCSHPASHAHHVVFRSHGGDDDPGNLVATCAFHHLRCLHGGWLRVTGEAPHGLTWFLRGAPWLGPTPATA